ncbi:unnamed protein product [Caenorhabditis angaria]|uniref:Glycosyltransferase family 92 protein n=1 Tax=Caenorhabditis angaria TaxID=860376 RepID=A0A9P1N1I8_9PELO|nr:unnamed protein product [Caenorhabditis angaria]
MFCRFLDCERKEIGEPYESEVFPEAVIFCPRRKGVRYISVTRKLDEQVGESVELRRRDFEAPPHEFAICISPLYGTEPKWLQITEFIENHKLHGVSFFYFYILSISSYDQRILNNYQKSGFIEIVPIQDKFERPALLYQQIQIQDCHQRSKNHAKWVAFIDLDERLEVFGNYRFLDELRLIENPNIGEIQMQVQRILKTGDYPEKYDGKLENIGRSVAHVRWKNATRATWDAMKLIVRPEKIAILSVHYVIAKYPGVQAIQQNPEKAHFRHYRNTKFQDFGENWENDYENFSISPLNPRFSKVLTRKIAEKIDEVYGKVKFDCKTMAEFSWKARKMIDPCWNTLSDFQFTEFQRFLKVIGEIQYQKIYDDNSIFCKEKNLTMLLTVSKLQYFSNSIYKKICFLCLSIQPSFEQNFRLLLIYLLRATKREQIYVLMEKKVVFQICNFGGDPYGRKKEKKKKNLIRSYCIYTTVLLKFSFSTKRTTFSEPQNGNKMFVFEVKISKAHDEKVEIFNCIYTTVLRLIFYLSNVKRSQIGDIIVSFSELQNGTKNLEKKNTISAKSKKK